MGLFLQLLILINPCAIPVRTDRLDQIPQVGGRGHPLLRETLESVLRDKFAQEREFSSSRKMASAVAVHKTACLKETVAEGLKIIPKLGEGFRVLAKRWIVERTFLLADSFPASFQRL